MIPVCSICKVKTERGNDPTEFICPKCSAIYYPDREIVEYEDEFISAHEDEHVELSGIGTGPLAAATTEGSAVSELYKKERNPLSYQPREGETVVYEEIYIPPEE